MAECQPRVRHWRSYARTRRMKTRESERGGAAPNVCSQTRRKLAKSKPSKTTFRPTPVSCGIPERSLLCSIKSSLMRDFRVRSSLPRSSPRSRFEPAVRTPGEPVARHPQPRSRKPVLRRETPSILRGFQGPSKLLICGLFQKSRVLAQNGVQEAGLGVAAAPSVSLISTDSLSAPACPAVSDPSSPRDLPPCYETLPHHCRGVALPSVRMRNAGDRSPSAYRM